MLTKATEEECDAMRHACALRVGYAGLAARLQVPYILTSSSTLNVLYPFVLAGGNQVGRRFE